MTMRRLPLVLVLAASSGAASAGSLRVCASDLVNFDDTPALAVPGGLIFTEWGSASGDLRQMRLDPNYPPARRSGQGALVTTGEVTLTADAPCALAPARALVSPRHGWRTAMIDPAANTVFEAADTLDGRQGDGRQGDSGQGDTYALLTMNALAARPVESIGNPQSIP